MFDFFVSFQIRGKGRGVAALVTWKSRKMNVVNSMSINYYTITHYMHIIYCVFIKFCIFYKKVSRYIKKNKTSRKIYG